MFASSEVWLLQSVAGIQPHPAARGFSKVLIKPSPPAKLAHASGSYDTVRGRITTSWTKDAAAGKVTLNLVVPPNVEATVHVPSTTSNGSDDGAVSGNTGRVLESGVPMEGGRQESDSVVFEVGSGEYEFQSWLA